MVISAAGFALMGALVKSAGQSSLPVMQIIAARALVSLILSYADIKRLGVSVWGHNKPLLFARGLVGFLALLCVYYSLVHLPLAEATLLQYTHPMFTLLIALLALGEGIRRNTITCLALSLIGLLLIVSPSLILGSPQQSLASLPIAIALLGALGSAVAYVIVRKLAATEHSSVIIFYFPLVCLPATAALGWREFVWPTGIECLILLGVGVFTQIGQLGLTKGLALHNAGIVVAFSYVQVPMAVVLGILFFEETPTLWVLAGGLCILAGAWINTQNTPSKTLEIR